MYVAWDLLSLETVFLMQDFWEGNIATADVLKGTAIGKPLFDHLFCIKTHLKIFWWNLLPTFVIEKCISTAFVYMWESGVLESTEKLLFGVTALAVHIRFL